MRKKIKIAAIFNQKKSSGGGFNECVNNAVRLQKIKTLNVDITYVMEKGSDFYPLVDMGIVPTYFKFGYKNKIKTYIHRQIIRKLPAKYQKKMLSPFEAFLKDNEISLVYFLSPNSWALDLKNINYISTLWDNCHREELEFPEVRSNGIFDQREVFNKKTLNRSAAVIVDSQATKLALTHQYGINENRIWAIPFKPSPFLLQPTEIDCGKVLKKYNLENKNYIFYPAQFWPHKNHVFIMDALRIRKQSNPEAKMIKAVFCGNDKGNLDYLKRYAVRNDLGDDIRFLDFVPDTEIAAFYCGALALTMPSYFGPSNLPPLEAFKFKTPVIYPNKSEFQSFLDGACLPIQLDDPESLSLQLELLLTVPGLRRELIDKGLAKLAKIEKFNDVSILEQVFKIFAQKYHCWHD